MTERHRKIRSMLVYLSKERSVAAALAKLLSFMPEAERAKARAKVLESVRLYDASVAAAVVSPDFSTFNGASLPSWFEAEYHSARLPNWLLSISATRRYFLPSLVEPRARVSAHSCCLPLHSFLCRLLLSPDTEPGARVQVWGRVGTKLELLDTVECDENCDNLHQIRSRPLCERQKLFKSLLLSNENSHK